MVEIFTKIGTFLNYICRAVLLEYFLKPGYHLRKYERIFALVHKI
jgi:hypothetical protein